MQTTPTKEPVFDAQKWAAKFWSSFRSYTLLDNMFMDPYALEKFVPLPNACETLPEEEKRRIHLNLQESTARDFASILRAQSGLMTIAAAAYFDAVLKDFVKLIFVWYPKKMQLIENKPDATAHIPAAEEIPDPDSARPRLADRLAEEISCRSLRDRFRIIEELTGVALAPDLVSSIEDIFFLRDEMVQEETIEDLGRQKLLWIFSTLPSKLLASLEAMCRDLDVPFTSTAKHDLATAA